ncbi:MAG: hypothetical protein CW691_06880, partial [Candidatus Bathyarchaeum sp.]
STISGLSFNSTSRTLSFNTEGDNGTQNYAKITVADDLVSSLDGMQVYLNGNKTEYSLFSNSDSLYLIVPYTQNNNQIIVNLGAIDAPILSTELILLLLLLVIAVIGIVVVKRLRQGKNKSS